MKKLYIIPNERAACYIVNKLYDEGYKWWSTYSLLCDNDKHRHNRYMKAIVANENKILFFHSGHTWGNESQYDEVYEVEEQIDFYLKKKEEKVFGAGNIIVGDFGAGEVVYVLICTGGILKAVNVTVGSTWTHGYQLKGDGHQWSANQLIQWNILPLDKDPDYKVYDSFDDYLEMVHLVPGSIT